MIHAAGILFLTPDRRALFLRRGDGGDAPGMWCTPGGKVEDGETPQQAAVRETMEEAAREVAPKDLEPLCRTVSPAPVTASPVEVRPAADTDPGQVGEQVDFTTYLVRVTEEFAPTLNDEHTGWSWADVEAPPEPLHPGVRTALARLNMDELGVARAMMAGELSSPQRYMNVSLFALRITGTGLAYRSSLKEYVWRDPALYLNDEFVQRCYGLPVIMEHPEGATLDSGEWADRAVGTVVLPYIKNNDVWGIAKIYDDATVEMLSDPDHPLKSTSPTVVLRPGDEGSSKVTLEDGSALLIEGKPALLDHVALCPAGVWDKGGPPRGVAVADSAGDDRVTEEERKELEELRADKKRRDSETSGALDGIMKMCDSITKRMDAMEQADKARKDAETISGEAARAEALREGTADPVVPADAKRKDGEDDKKPAFLKEDKKKDADEDDKSEKEREEEGGRKGGEKSDSKRKDGEDDKSEKEREDKRADAVKVGDWVRDNEGDRGKVHEVKGSQVKVGWNSGVTTWADKKDVKADADGRQSEETQRRLRDIESRLPARLSDEDRAAMADAQARADGVYAAFGDSAPRPMDGEDLNAYRRRLAGKLRDKCRDEELRGVNLMAIHDAASFKFIEGRIYADAVEAARNPVDVPDGELREVVRTDSTGRRISEFYGRARSWLAPHRVEPMLVHSINKG